MKGPTKAKRTKSAVAGGALTNGWDRLMNITGRAGKTFVRRMRPFTKRMEPMAMDARKMVAKSLHQFARMLSSLEKTIAPPPARKARAKRAKPRGHVAPVEVSRSRGAAGEVAA